MMNKNMEKKVNKKIDDYVLSFKNYIRNKMTELDLVDEKSMSLLQYIFDYEKLEITNEDCHRQKRINATITASERCCARRGNGDQCTRRRKDSNMFCGTHDKNQPYGTIMTNNSVDDNHTIEVFVYDFKGVVHYIDNNCNVYNMEDIMKNNKNPSIIGKWKFDSSNEVRILC